MIEIRHRGSGKILFSLETNSIKVCVKAALKANADLRSADLSFADLSFADLRSADLSFANLSSANLSFANLRSANLRFADLDFSSGITFKCSSFGFKADLRLAAQMAYHFCRIDFGESPEATTAQECLKTLANKFHRVDECGHID